MSTPENKFEDQELEKQEIIDHESESQTQQKEKEQDAQTDQDQETAAETPLSEEEQLKKSLANEQDKFLRLFAEFENYKKRTSKERMDLLKQPIRR